MRTYDCRVEKPIVPIMQRSWSNAYIGANGRNTLVFGCIEVIEKFNNNSLLRDKNGKKSKQDDRVATEITKSKDRTFTACDIKRLEIN